MAKIRNRVIMSALRTLRRELDVHGHNDVNVDIVAEYYSMSRDEIETLSVQYETMRELRDLWQDPSLNA